MAKQIAAHGRGSLGGKGEVEDGTLLREIASGDLSGFDTFVNRYKRRLMGYISQRIGDNHQAEDLVQEVFMKAFRVTSSGGYVGKGSAASWLFTIATNSVRDYFRLRARRPLKLASELGHEEDAGNLIESRASTFPGPVKQAMSSERKSQIDTVLALP